MIFECFCLSLLTHLLNTGNIWSCISSGENPCSLSTKLSAHLASSLNCWDSDCTCFLLGYQKNYLIEPNTTDIPSLSFPPIKIPAQLMRYGSAFGCLKDEPARPKQTDLVATPGSLLFLSWLGIYELSENSVFIPIDDIAFITGS